MQGLFPLSQFVFITRHPLITAHALQKWTDTPVDELARYGVAGYRRMFDDLRYLHAAMVIRYEDLVARPQVHCRAIEAFLSLPAQIEPGELRRGNTDYDPAADDSGSIAELGYADGGEVETFTPIVRHPLRAVHENTEARLGTK